MMILSSRYGWLVWRSLHCWSWDALVMQVLNTLHIRKVLSSCLSDWIRAQIQGGKPLHAWKVLSSSVSDLIEAQIQGDKSLHPRKVWAPTSAIGLELRSSEVRFRRFERYSASASVMLFPQSFKEVRPCMLASSRISAFPIGLELRSKEVSQCIFESWWSPVPTLMEFQLRSKQVRPFRLERYWAPASPIWLERRFKEVSLCKLERCSTPASPILLERRSNAVSYTHLTLPTIYSV